VTDSEVITLEIVGEFLGKIKTRGFGGILGIIGTRVSEFRSQANFAKQCATSMGDKATPY